MSAPESRTALRHRFLIAAAFAILLVAGVVFQAVASTTATPPYLRTVIVSPKGSSQQDGAVLLEALAGITGATQSNPYLVKIEPGTYDVYLKPVLMKEWVDIEGSGELNTLIVGSGGVTVLGASNAELRLLSVQSNGGNPGSVAIYNNATSPRLTNVSATATKGAEYSHGVQNRDASPIMTNVTASSSSYNAPTAYSAGVYNYRSSPRMTNVTATDIGTGHGVINLSSKAEIANSKMVSGPSYIPGRSVTRYYPGIYNSGGDSSVANSQIVEGIIDEGPPPAPSLRCIGNYTSSMAPITCPTPIAITTPVSSVNQPKVSP